MSSRNRMLNKKYKVLPSKIQKSISLKSNVIYVIKGEVRVLQGVRIKAEDKCMLYIVNGIFKNSCLKRSALIFNQGSFLDARVLTIKACDNNHKQEKKANNGGIWFLGSNASASKDGISIKRRHITKSSIYSANSLNVSYLGREDGNTNNDDDIDGISILGLTKSEWQIKKLKSTFSGDDAIDITNSHITLDHLEVDQPVEDGINLSSSRLEINRRIKIKMPKNGIRDRDLFDFEVDDGASYLEIHKGCLVDIHGVFGDQIILSSEEMPKPVNRHDNERTYRFNRKLKKSALIYTIDKD